MTRARHLLSLARRAPYIGTTRNFADLAANRHHLVVNAVGEDRPGIVSEISRIVHDAGGNVGDSQAAKLGTHFGLMMYVSIPSGKAESLRRDLESMEEMSASVFETGDPWAVKVTPKIGCEYCAVFISTPPPPSPTPSISVVVVSSASFPLPPKNNPSVASFHSARLGVVHPVRGRQPWNRPRADVPPRSAQPQHRPDAYLSGGSTLRGCDALQRRGGRQRRRTVGVALRPGADRDRDFGFGEPTEL